MKNGFKRALTMSCAAFCVTVVARAQMSVSQAAAPVQTETLLETQSSWDGTPYVAYPAGTPQLSVLKIVIPPGEALKWHLHDVPNAAYVAAGALTVERHRDGLHRSLKAGEVLPEMVKSLHRGIAGPQGATLIVFYAGKKGVPLSRP